MSDDEDDDVTFSLSPGQSVELERIARNRGTMLATLIGEALKMWSVTHAGQDGMLRAREWRS